MQATGLEIDAVVDIHEDGGRIAIEALHEPAYDLAELLGEITPENIHQEIQVGSPVGLEIF